MGVQGLWQILAPAGRRISIESLEGKKLAVDVSIWIVQFIKAMRDENGNMIKNAHLLGVLRRLLKLLYNRILPVFVFDGKTPELKYQTVKNRKKLGEDEELNIKKAARRLLLHQLKVDQLKFTNDLSNQPSAISNTFRLNKPVSEEIQIAGSEPNALISNNTQSQVISAPFWTESDTSSDDSDCVADVLEEFDVKCVANMKLSARKAVMKAKRKQLMVASREKCLAAASNPELYSQTQVSNFLGSSEFNRKVEAVQHIIKSQNNKASESHSSNMKSFVHSNDMSDGEGWVVDENYDDYERQKGMNNDENEDNGGGFFIDEPSMINIGSKKNISVLLSLEDSEDDNLYDTDDSDEESAGVADDVDAAYVRKSNGDAAIESSSTETLRQKESTQGSNAIPVDDNDEGEEEDISWEDGSVVKDRENMHDIRSDDEDVELGEVYPTLILEIEDNESNSSVMNQTYAIQQAILSGDNITDSLGSQFEKVSDPLALNSHISVETSRCEIAQISSSKTNEDIKIDNVSSQSFYNGNLPEKFMFHESDKQIDTVEFNGKDLTDVIKRLQNERNQSLRDVEVMTKELSEEVKRMLILLDIPFIVAPYEAEAQCAELERLGLVDGVITEDSDVFLFGAKHVYKNIFDDGKFVEAYDLKDIQKDIGVGRSECISVAYLTGSDYTSGVFGIGPVNAMEVIDAFCGSTPYISDESEISKTVLEGLDSFKRWLQLDIETEITFEIKNASVSFQKFAENHKIARNKWVVAESFPDARVVHAYLHPVVTSDASPFAWCKTPLEEVTRLLVKFCCITLNWDEITISRHLIKESLQRFYGSITSHQTTLESYFTSYEDNVKGNAVASERLLKAYASRSGSMGGVVSNVKAKSAKRKSDEIPIKLKMKRQKRKGKIDSDSELSEK